MASAHAARLDSSMTRFDAHPISPHSPKQFPIQLLPLPIHLVAMLLQPKPSLEPAGLTTSIKFTRAMLGRRQTVWGTLYGRGGITVTSIRSVQERKTANPILVPVPPKMTRVLFFLNKSFPKPTPNQVLDPKARFIRQPTWFRAADSLSCGGLGDSMSIKSMSQIAGTTRE